MEFYFFECPLIILFTLGTFFYKYIDMGIYLRHFDDDNNNNNNNTQLSIIPFIGNKNVAFPPVLLPEVGDRYLGSVFWYFGTTKVKI